MTSYINDSITELAQLQGIDERISELNRSILAVKQQADAKINGAPVASTSVSNNEAKTAANELVAQLNSSSTSAENLGQFGANLPEKYCHVEVLHAVQNKLDEKLQIQDNIAYVKRAISLQAQLNDTLLANSSNDGSQDSVLEALLPLALELSEFKQVQNGLSVEVVPILDTSLDAVVETCRKALESSLNEVLVSNNWLGKNQGNISNDLMKQIRKYVTQLVELQSINNLPTYPHTWWSLDILLSPIISRFDFHFNSKRETNQISKPEWALEFVETFLADNLTILNMVVGDIFRSRNKIVEFEVITSLLSPVRAKLMKITGVLNKNIDAYSEDPINLEKSGRLLSHLIFEVSGFDQRVRNTYKYNPFIKSFDEVPEEQWEGLTGDILTADEINLENWLTFERKLSHNRFQTEILKAKDAYSIDFDYHGSQENKQQDLKPTYSAYNLTKLFTNLTSHFYSLTTLNFQIKYVKTIQLELLDLYYEDLLRLFRTFNAAFQLKSVFSFLPGSAKETTNDLDTNNVTNGLKALDSLTGIYCSAMFISQSLEQWCNELSFIQINKHEKKNIFQQSIDDYHELISSIMKKYEEFFIKEIRFTLKNYVNSSSWDSEKINVDDLPSTDLTLLTTTLPIYLNQLKKSVSALEYTLITDKVVSIISKVFYEYVVNNNQFTKSGISQLKIDIDFITNQFHSLLNLNSDGEFSNDANSDYVKLRQSIRLLDTIDKEDSGAFTSGRKSMSELRSKFEDKLNQLTNHDILSLLPRLL